MKKMLLKKRKRSNLKMLFCFIVLIFISFTVLSLKLSYSVDDFILNLSEIEVKKISKKILNEAINKTLLDCAEINSLFVVEKNESGDIKEIDVDSVRANKILMLINKDINAYIKELEEGKSSIVDIKNSLTTNKKFFSDKPGIVFEIPIGVVTNNSTLSNLGPKIPIKVSLNGELKSQLKTKIENYGINNALIKLIINVEVSEQIVMPLTSREVIFDTDIIIAMKMIQGDVPGYYIGGINQNKFDDIT